MSENLRSRDGSSMYAHIEATPMPDFERQNALGALEMAETLVDGFVWTWKRLGDLAGYLFLKPGVKH